MQKNFTPGVVLWSGTFLAAGSNLLVASFSEKTKQKRDALISSALTVGIAGPLVGLAMWKVLSLTLFENPVSKKQSLASIVLASIVGSNLLHSQHELEAVNGVIWLRVAGGVWALSGRMGVDVLSLLSIAATFHGVLFHPDKAPRALVKMTKSYVSPPLFAELTTNKTTTTKKEKVFSQAVGVFFRTWKGLFAYNYFLHVAAALVSLVVRLLGSSFVKGVKSKPDMHVWAILKRAIQEATVLNLAVSCSTTALFLGCTAHPMVGLSMVGLPLLGCNARVKDTVYFLFLPWCVKYLVNLFEASSLNVRSRILLGAYLLEHPLKVYLENHEGYSWMVSVAFGLAQKLANATLL